MEMESGRPMSSTTGLQDPKDWIYKQQNKCGTYNSLVNREALAAELLPVELEAFST